MIVAQEMQDAVHDEQSGLVLHRNIVLARLPNGQGVGQYHLPQTRWFIRQRREHNPRLRSLLPWGEKVRMRVKPHVGKRNGRKRK